MKYIINTQNKTNKLPEFGQVWRHEGDNNLYMRINPDNGSSIKINNIDNNMFYSVCLEDGIMCHTSIHARDIEITSTVPTFTF